MRQLAVFGAVCFFVIAIATLPARIPLQLIANDRLMFSGVNGTIWQASVNVITVEGIQLRNTEWELSPLTLLTGRLGGDLKSRWNAGFLNANFAASLFGTLALRNAEINTTAAWLAGAARLPPLDGQVRIAIDELEVSDNWPELLIATIQLDGLASTLIGVGDQGYLGNMIAEFDSRTGASAEQLTGLIRDAGGPLALDGTLVLTKPGSYALRVFVTPRAEASEGLRQNLGFLGSANADGAYLFELAGDI